MSSQGQGTALQHAPDNRGYRLIELPPELQLVLESDNPPVFVASTPPFLRHHLLLTRHSSLKLDSTDTSAVLKSPHKTYALRQKNTSNAIVLIEPHASSDGPDAGLGAVATIHETVELDHVQEPNPSVGPLKHTGSKGKWHEKFGRGR